MQVPLSISGRPWRFRELDERSALAISQRHGLSQILGQVLAARGVAVEAVPSFIEPRLRDCLPDPSHLLDLDRAARRIAEAIRGTEPVGIIGDYDVDGATSTALMVRYLRSFGLEPRVLIPDRLADGYGASAAAFDRLAAGGCRLCLTLDNGTTAFAALAHAAGNGQEVIVVDHHAGEPELPPAYGIVNPNRVDQESELTHLAAVGVTFVLIVAVNRELRRSCPALPRIDPLLWLDLVALGTTCDVVPLTGLNRAFVRQGLRVAARTTLPGLRALADRVGVACIDDVWHLGFLLGPRINAGSRLGACDLGPRLLMTDDGSEAAEIAERLHALNQERQALERSILAQAERAVQGQVEAGRRVLVAAGEGWHAGVIGIVASRLLERYHRPVFAVALDGASAKGSARSLPGFNVGEIVIAARRAGLLLTGGGHAMAAGLTTRADLLQHFTDFAEERAAAAVASGALAGRPLELDGAITVAGVTSDLALDLERMAPCGPGNAEPRFCIADGRIVDTRPVGENHLACWIAGASSGRLKGIAFRSRDTALGQALTAPGAPLKLAGRIKVDRWNGQIRACFEIEDAAT